EIARINSTAGVTSSHLNCRSLFLADGSRRGGMPERLSPMAAAWAMSPCPFPENVFSRHFPPAPGAGGKMVVISEEPPPWRRPRSRLRSELHGHAERFDRVLDGGTRQLEELGVEGLLRVDAEVLGRGVPLGR